VPVPKRFDRRPPERDDTRINERIRVPEVRLIGDDGEQIGIVKRDDALRYAQERDLDLVEVAAGAKPPVCRVLDYSKYKYEQEQRQKAARKHQTQITIREIKFRPKIALNDYETKKGHVTRFLKQRDKVKVTIMFRGREVTHPERGVALLERLADELQDLAVVEQRPIQDGRNMTMMLGPSKAILDAPEEEHEDHAAAGKTSRRERLKAEKQAAAAAEHEGDTPDAPDAGEDEAPAEEAPAAAEDAAPSAEESAPAGEDAPAEQPAAEAEAEQPAEPQPEPAERA
jgi:translation initiation factor IF-3